MPGPAGCRPIAVTAAGVGTATLSWVAPTLNDDGTPLQGLAGYVVFYGTNSAALDHSASINDPATLSYQIRNLPSGTWYFGVVSVTGAGVQSRLSTLVSKTIS